MQIRLQKRHSRDQCSKYIISKKAERNAANPYVISNLEHNKKDHVGPGLAEALADYIGYNSDPERQEFLAVVQKRVYRGEDTGDEPESASRTDKAHHLGGVKSHKRIGGGVGRSGKE